MTPFGCCHQLPAPRPTEHPLSAGVDKSSVPARSSVPPTFPNWVAADGSIPRAPTASARPGDPAAWATNHTARCCGTPLGSGRRSRSPAMRSQSTGFGEVGRAVVGHRGVGLRHSSDVSGGGAPGDSDPVEAQRKRADRAVGWIVSVLIVGVGVNLLSDAVVGSPLAWIAPAMFVLVAAITLFPQGMLRWERHGNEGWALFLAVVMVAGYLVAVWWATTTTSWSLPVLLVQALLLWAAAVLVCWQTLREDVDLEDAARGVVVLLWGVSGLVVGASALRQRSFLEGSGLILWGVTGLRMGLAELRDTDPFDSLARLMFGAGCSLLGLGFLLAGHLLPAALFLTLVAVAVVIGLMYGLGVSVRGERAWALLGGALVIAGVGLVGTGAAARWDGNLLYGTSGLLAGVGLALLGGLTIRRARHGGTDITDAAALGVVVAVVLVAAAVMLVGFGFMRDGSRLSGLVMLLFGVVLLLTISVRAWQAGVDILAARIWDGTHDWLLRDRSRSSKDPPPTDDSPGGG